MERNHIKHFVSQTRTLLKVTCASRSSDAHGPRCGHPCYIECYFAIKKGSGTHSDTKLGGKGEVLVIPMPEKSVPERRSHLRPSEKELPERRSCAFRHKNSHGCISHWGWTIGPLVAAVQRYSLTTPTSSSANYAVADNLALKTAGCCSRTWQHCLCRRKRQFQLSCVHFSHTKHQFLRDEQDVHT
jgi:hypothetical protein